MYYTEHQTEKQNVINYFKNKRYNVAIVCSALSILNLIIVIILLCSYNLYSIVAINDEMVNYSINFSITTIYFDGSCVSTKENFKLQCEMFKKLNDHSPLNFDSLIKQQASRIINEDNSVLAEAIASIVANSNKVSVCSFVILFLTCVTIKLIILILILLNFYARKNEENKIRISIIAGNLINNIIQVICVLLILYSGAHLNADNFQIIDNLADNQIRLGAGLYFYIFAATISFFNSLASVLLTNKIYTLSVDEKVDYFRSLMILSGSYSLCVPNEYNDY